MLHCSIRLPTSPTPTRPRGACGRGLANPPTRLTTMQKLKLLPWLARRSGVALERAEELWRQAIALADFRESGDGRSNDYWGYAMRTLIKLLRADGVAMLDANQARPVAAVRRPAGQLLASQHRLGVLAFDAAEAYVRAANEIWHRTW